MSPESAIAELLVCVDNGCPHDDQCGGGCRAVEACRESVRLDKPNASGYRDPAHIACICSQRMALMANPDCPIHGDGTAPETGDGR